MTDSATSPLAGFSIDDLQDEIDRRFKESGSIGFSIVKELKRVMSLSEDERTGMECDVREYVTADGSGIYRVTRHGAEILKSIYDVRQAAKRNSK